MSKVRNILPNILIVLPNLGGGGAERLHLNLAHDWAAKGYNVQIALLNVTGELLPLVSKEIKIIDLDSKRLRCAFIKLYKLFKDHNYDVVITALWPLTSISIITWLTAGRKGRLYVSEHNQLSISCIREQKIPSIIFRAIISFTHRFASGVIAVSKGVRDDLSSLAKMSRDSIKVIYNPAATGVSPLRETPDVSSELWGRGYKYHILSVGRLKKQKDYETLIRAVAHLPEDLNVKLTILGEGPLRQNLEALIVQLGLQVRVSLPGFVTDPYPWFRSADLFVLSSQWEGFGNVIVEALECGVPVVSTDCPSGPSEILDNGIYGRLVPVGDAAMLSAAIIQSLDDKYDRELLISRAKYFSVRNVSDQYLAYCFPGGI